MASGGAVEPWGVIGLPKVSLRLFGAQNSVREDGTLKKFVGLKVVTTPALAIALNLSSVNRSCPCTLIALRSVHCTDHSFHRIKKN